jgi:hypothetical protein
MKKLFFLFFSLCVFAFANGFVVMKIQPGKGILKYHTSIEKMGKTYFLFARYAGPIVKNRKKLGETFENMIDEVCQNPQTKKEVENGYKFEVVFVYDDAVFRGTINECK